jgi:hypothetical protein
MRSDEHSGAGRSQMAVLQHLCSGSSSPNLTLILTITNVGRPRRVVEERGWVLEVIGKRYDMQVIVDSVKQAFPES